MLRLFFKMCFSFSYTIYGQCKRLCILSAETLLVKISCRISFFLLPLALIAGILTGQGQTCVPEYATKTGYFEGSGTGGFAVRQPTGEFYYGAHGGGMTYIEKLDKDGSPIWVKGYYTNQMYSSILICGAVDSVGKLLATIMEDVLFFINSDGSTAGGFQLKLINSNVRFQKIIVLPDNKKLVLVKDLSAYATDCYLLLCLSPDCSSVLWTKALFKYGLFFNDMVLRNSSVVLSGTDGDGGVLVEFNATTGALNRQIRTKVGDANTQFRNIYKTTNGYLVTGVNYGTNGENRAFYIRLNEDLSVITVNRFSSMPEYTVPLLSVNADGSFYGLEPGTFDVIRFYISPTDTIVWRRFIGVAGLGTSVYFNGAPDGLISFSIGNYYAVGVGIYYCNRVFTKTTYEGIRPGCDWSPSNMSLQPGTISGFSPLLTIRDTSMVTLLPVTINSAPYGLEYANACNLYSTCSSLSVAGPAVICAPDTVEFTAFRDPGCHLPVNWDITGGPVQTFRPTDSTVSVIFSQAGTYRIISTLGQDCIHIADTMYVEVSSLNSTLDLGPRDTTLCAGGSLLLNAHAGFLNYQWQDGSADSVFLVTTPGLYYVTAQSTCGQTFSDTIRVTAAAVIPFSAGPDRDRCNNDTVQLRATPGFMNYTWGPDYYLNQTGQNWVVTSTPVDTIYYVKAESATGCYLYDTVRVAVKTSPPVNLGPDFSVCRGDSTQLTAQPGFQQYIWNTGSQSSFIYVKTPGLYTVSATANNGCVSRDTVSLLQLWELPDPDINGDTSLCAGETIQLNPGNFTSYWWQDGSTTPTFLVQAPGIFYVRVTNDNGCKGTDTLNLPRQIPLPAGFLPADTAICAYGSMELKASGIYSQYLWNNLSTSPNIQVNTAGKYWLQVTTREGCKGADTVQVFLKDCAKGLFVPGAFTPNNDGLNDKLVPFLFGDVIKFRFDIYNRNGEKVFSTVDTRSGWDGRLRGMVQDAAVYVWICQYQLNGEKPVVEKGTFVLIR